jgi:protein-S-isoprenylcysteine O-methyltransferase Ste14
MDKPRENAGVIAPPPLIAALTIVLGLILDRVLPAYVLLVLLSREERWLIGGCLGLAGAALALVGEFSFHRAGTATMPWKPASALVTGGVYAYVRNPMYVGVALLIGAVGVALASDWTLVMMVPAAFVMHFGVVKREERYLAAKFGEPYRRYLETVPRYGWPG